MLKSKPQQAISDIICAVENADALLRNAFHSIDTRLELSIIKCHLDEHNDAFEYRH